MSFCKILHKGKPLYKQHEIFRYKVNAIVCCFNFNLNVSCFQDEKKGCAQTSLSIFYEASCVYVPQKHFTELLCLSST